MDYLTELWEGAVQIANKHVPERKSAVASEVASRLQGIGRHSKAAALLSESGLHEQALSVCLAHSLWTLGYEICCNLPPEARKRLDIARLNQGNQSAKTRADRWFLGAKRKSTEDQELPRVEHERPRCKGLCNFWTDCCTGCCVCLQMLFACGLLVHIWKEARRRAFRLRTVYPMLAGTQVRLNFIPSIVVFRCRYAPL